MSIKNRLELCAFLAKSCAYEGKKDLASVKAFLADNKDVIELKDASGKDIDVDAIWAKTVHVVADAGEIVRVMKSDANDDGNDNDSSTDSDLVGNSNKTPIKAKGVKGFAIRSDRNMKAKSYNAKSNAVLGRKTYFDDADKMEAFNAAARLEIASVNSINNYSQKANDLEIVGKDGSELVNSLGGNLVADVFNSELIYRTEQYGVAGKVANLKEMQVGGNNIWPRKSTIVTMNHLQQGNAITPSDNTYDQVQLVPKQVAALILESRQILDNAAINLGDDLAATFVEAQLVREDTDYTLGDGSATYGGHVGLVAALPSGAYITGVANSWAGQTTAYLISAMGAVQNVVWSRCAWVMSRQAFVNIFVRLDDTRFGTSGADINLRYVQNMPWQAEAFGFPVYFSQVMPTTSAGTTKYAYFGDFVGGSMLGRRKGLQIDSSKDYKFSTNQIAFRGVADIAVNVHGDGRATTVGPIAGLQTS